MERIDGAGPGEFFGIRTGSRRHQFEKESILSSSEMKSAQIAEEPAPLPRAAEAPRPSLELAREPRAEASGRHARLKSMVSEHFDLIWRLLRRLGVPASSVDDAAQEVFVVAARRVDDIALGSERSYLFGTALRVAKGMRRQLARHSAEPLSAEPVAPQRAPDELLEQKRQVALLDELLGRLDEGERSVFVLFELEGLTLTEIAELLVVPRGTVASRLRRGRGRFMRALEARTGRTAPMRGHDE